MSPDWKSDLVGREPAEPAPSDPAADQRIQLMQRAHYYEVAATRWCIQAKDSAARARRLRREARGAEIVAGVLVLVVGYLVLRMIL